MSWEPSVYPVPRLDPRARSHRHGAPFPSAFSCNTNRSDSIPIITSGNAGAAIQERRMEKLTRQLKHHRDRWARFDELVSGGTEHRSRCRWYQFNRQVGPSWVKAGRQPNSCVWRNQLLSLNFWRTGTTNWENGSQEGIGNTPGIPGRSPVYSTEKTLRSHEPDL